MSPHRIQYMDMRPKPVKAPRRDIGKVLAITLVSVLVSVLLVHAAFKAVGAVENARIEGFRAGSAAAMEQACKAAPLSPPLDSL
jgi:hypothetical protein